MTGLIRYDPFGLSAFGELPVMARRLFSELEELDRLYECGCTPSYDNEGKKRWAVTEWKTEDKAYVGNVELPGVNKDDIKIKAVDNGLEIRAEQYTKKEEKGVKSETRSSFQSYQRMPEDAVLDSIEAVYKDGMLTLNVPRSEQKKEEKKSIEIKVK